MKGREVKCMSYNDFLASFAQGNTTIIEELKQKGEFLKLFIDENGNEITIDFSEFIFFESLARSNKFELMDSLEIFSHDGQLNRGESNINFFF